MRAVPEGLPGLLVGGRRRPGCLAPARRTAIGGVPCGPPSLVLERVPGMVEGPHGVEATTAHDVRVGSPGALDECGADLRRRCVPRDAEYLERIAGVTHGRLSTPSHARSTTRWMTLGRSATRAWRSAGSK